MPIMIGNTLQRNAPASVPVVPVVNPDFVTTWDTENAGSATMTIEIPVYGDGYDCIVDWGDGSTEPYVGGVAATPAVISHVYATTGIKTITISGVFPQIYFNFGGDSLKLLTIENWGTGVWREMNAAFGGCANMVGIYTDFPDTAAVTNMGGMFNGCTAFNQSVAFDTAAVTDMNSMFANCTAFNQSVAFDTAAVTDMNAMFYGCTAFNQSVAGFDTAAVTDMNSMFANCTAFNQSVNNFDTAAVEDMIEMFAGCTAFNQSVNNFDTAAVTNMTAMFAGCNAFNQSVANFDTAAVTDMSYMFDGCNAFNQSVANFDTAAVTDMEGMFAGCTAFNQSVASFDTAAVTTMSGMFADCTAFKQSLATFDIALVADFTDFATGCDINAPATATNYDATLIAWEAQVPIDSMIINFGSSKYTAGGAAATARAALVLDHSWDITDGGTL